MRGSHPHGPGPCHPQIRPLRPQGGRRPRILEGPHLGKPVLQRRKHRRVQCKGSEGVRGRRWCPLPFSGTLLPTVRLEFQGWDPWHWRLISLVTSPARSLWHRELQQISRDPAPIPLQAAVLGGGSAVGGPPQWNEGSGACQACAPTACLRSPPQIESSGSSKPFGDGKFSLHVSKS